MVQLACPNCRHLPPAKTPPPKSKPKSKSMAESNSNTNNATRRSGRIADRKQQTEKLKKDSAVVDIEDFAKDDAESIRASLLQWYDANRRELPWRKNKKSGCGESEGEEEGEERRAYEVWVSEMMLQQTRVASVVSYYNKWMDRWPTVHSLASASQEEVNEMWAGLGYYRRARFLLEGAKSIAKEGQFPRTASALRSVPGIGNYTSGAIASIAFNEAVPVVDGNVVRVISRLKAISANPKESATVKHLWKLSGQLVDPSRPGDFNQSIMELGATLCSTTNPNCSKCPISNYCQALTLSKNTKTKVKVTDFPAKAPKTKQRHEFAAVCVVQIQMEINQENGSYFLLIKRPEEGLLAGLWEFPLVLVDQKSTNSKTRREEMDKYLENLLKLEIGKNCNLVLREDIGEYLHIFSHIRLRMHVELMVLTMKGKLDQLGNNDGKCKLTWKLVDENSMESIGLTSGIRKVYNMIQNFKEKMLRDTDAPKRKPKRSRS